MFTLGFTICLWGVFPRYLGISMCLAGCGYGLNSCLFLFWPGYDGLITWLLLIPALITHFWLAGWLLVNTPHPSKNRNIFGSSSSAPSSHQEMDKIAATYEQPAYEETRDPNSPRAQQQP